jgi:hypothetical protein
LECRYCYIGLDDGGTCGKSGRAEIMEACIADDRLGFLRPKMDGKFFLLGDGRWVGLMDHDLNEGDLFQGHLAAVADQVREQVLKGLDS